MRKKYVFLMFTLLVLPLAAGSAFADSHGGGYGCEGSSCKKSCSWGERGKASGGCPIVEKFMKKAHFFLDNQADIGLSDEQVRKIKAMKIEMKKMMVRGKADQQIFALEMKSKLGEPALNVEGINASIDQATAAMAVSAKAMVAALVELKGVLTEEQMAKAKEIWKKR